MNGHKASTKNKSYYLKPTRQHFSPSFSEDGIKGKSCGVSSWYLREICDALLSEDI